MAISILSFVGDPALSTLVLAGVALLVADFPCTSKLAEGESRDGVEKGSRDVAEPAPGLDFPWNYDCHEESNAGENQRG